VDASTPWAKVDFGAMVLLLYIIYIFISSYVILVCTRKCKRAECMHDDRTSPNPQNEWTGDATAPSSCPGHDQEMRGMAGSASHENVALFPFSFHGYWSLGGAVSGSHRRKNTLLRNGEIRWLANVPVYKLVRLMHISCCQTENRAFTLVGSSHNHLPHIIMPINWGKTHCENNHRRIWFLRL
jgi:hypothetical protein